MDFKIPKFDDLKDRLGFKDAAHARPSSSQDDSYDDFDHEDFGEYAFDDNADYAREPYKDASSTASFSPQMPKLVTADDVRTHTQYKPNEEAIDAASRGERPAAALKPEEQRSAGLGGLFEPAASQGAHAAQESAPVSAAQTGAFAAVRDVPAMPSAEQERPESAVQPRVVQRATRILTVIKPESYADAERIAKILKAGDVAVLSLRSTPDALGKRILDFSFGVACALDARVECVSGHVFALTRGAGLTEGETNRLRDQGLM